MKILLIRKQLDYQRRIGICSDSGLVLGTQFIIPKHKLAVEAE